MNDLQERLAFERISNGGTYLVGGSNVIVGIRIILGRAEGNQFQPG